MVRTVDAIYENGVFKPVEPISGLPERARVRVTFSPANSPPWADVIGIMPDEDAAEMRKIIEQEFSKVDPNDW